MTEAEGAGARDSLPLAELVEYLQNPSWRKLHLLVFHFICQTFDYLWHPPAQWHTPFHGKEYLPEFREAVESLEQFADGESDRDVSAGAVEVWQRIKEGAVMSQEFEFAAHCRDCQLSLLRTRVVPPMTEVTNLFVADIVPDNVPSPRTRKVREAAKVALLHEIFGPTLGPVAFDPAWRTPTVVALALQMYESREFGAMPILADALQDAGCDSDDVLNHCRGPGPHVRGCWVVDLVLGKT